MTDDAMRLAIQEACSVYNDNSLGEEAADSNGIAAVIAALLEKLRSEGMVEKTKVYALDKLTNAGLHKSAAEAGIYADYIARAVIEALEKELV